jgi:hypothetical protein
MRQRASVSLALSERGLHAIKTLNRPGLMETVLDCTIPLYGRMIHGHYRSGELWESSQAYDVLGRVSLTRSSAFKLGFAFFPRTSPKRALTISFPRSSLYTPPIASV